MARAKRTLCGKNFFLCNFLLIWQKKVKYKDYLSSDDSGTRQERLANSGVQDHFTLAGIFFSRIDISFIISSIHTHLANPILTLSFTDGSLI
jgi:hypothetical protein